MFGKKEPDMEVIIGHKSGVKGEISSSGTVRVDGSFEGNIVAESLIIGESGCVIGDITVKSGIIGGKMTGNIRANDCVEVRHSGVVYGDIYSVRIVMAEGAKFDGHSYMQRPREIEYQQQETL